MQTVGLYTDAGAILKNTAYFASLQRAVGLNLVIIGYSGQLPEKVVTKSPFYNQPDTITAIKSVLAQHIDGGLCSSQPELAANWVGPHMGRGGDDQALQRAIDQAHRLGLQVWLVAGAWTANDFKTLMFCPNHPAVNDWYEAVFVHLAEAYGVEGLDITHARYPMTSEPRGLGLCACPYCTRAAAEACYDMPRITKDINASISALRQLDMPLLRTLNWDLLSLTDLWQILGMRAGLFEWFTFRAQTLTRNLHRYHKQVHIVAGERFIFGADTYPSSMALFAGHDQAHWDLGSDFASPLISHVDIFVLKTWAAWARWLLIEIKGITEEEALRLVYRLTGYDGLNLPSAISGFALGEADCEFRNIPLRELLAYDMAKARMTLPPSVPSYPIIQGGGAPYLWPRHIIEGVIADAERLGHQGVMLQGTASLAPGVV